MDESITSYHIYFYKKNFLWTQSNLQLYIIKRLTPSYFQIKILDITLEDIIFHVNGNCIWTRHLINYKNWSMEPSDFGTFLRFQFEFKWISSFKYFIVKHSTIQDNKTCEYITLISCLMINWCFCLFNFVSVKGWSTSKSYTKI